MNHQEKLQAVTKAIQEAVPSLMELKMGCKLRSNQIFTTSNGFLTFDYDDVFTLIHKDTKYECILKHKAIRGTLDVTQKQLSEMKILGHPITIAEVLMWLEIHTGHKTSQGDHDRIPPIHVCELLYKWNLTLPLDQQEPEVIDFLFTLTQS